MDKQNDILRARREARVTQRELEVELEYPSGAISAIEWSKMGISEETYQMIHAAIRAISTRKKEAAQCRPETTASAAS